MKFEAHPLVVAAALGLIGPGALAEDDDDPDTEECCRSEEQKVLGGLAPTTARVDLLSEPSEWTWSPAGEAPDPEAFHRVATEWLKLG